MDIETYIKAERRQFVEKKGNSSGRQSWANMNEA